MNALVELHFAQQFPFSETAKRIIKEKKISLDTVPESVLQRAKAMVEASDKKKTYAPHIASSRSFLENEILAFPVAKVIVSLQNDSRQWEKFSRMVANTTFSHLMANEKKKKVLLDLADEMNVKFTYLTTSPFFVKLDLVDFLEINFNDDLLKVVNQKIEKGQIYLKEDAFARFLAELVFARVFSSFPVEGKFIPAKLKDEASRVAGQIKIKRKREFKEVFGKVDVESFPPCMAEIYADMLEGKRVAHLARFDLATFLVAVNMPIEQIITLFKNTPNFNEKVTRYQVERIAGKKGTRYSPPNCAKIHSHQLCKKITECNRINHPIQFYKNRKRAKKK
jgi:DNA primase large subunit